MEDNKTLTQTISKLPKNCEITYSQKITKEFNIPYTLTVKGYKKFYLNEVELPDLNFNEQIILLNSNTRNNLHTPSNTVAAIFKARHILERSENIDEAIVKCNQALLKENKNFFDEKLKISEDISKKTVYANQLEYYLNLIQTYSKYTSKPTYKFHWLINFKNKILEKITKKCYTTLPISEKELEKGKKVWSDFRQKQQASPDLTDEELLHQYRYDSNIDTENSFQSIAQSEELNNLLEQYTISNITLQILDGTAFAKAKKSLLKNNFEHLSKANAKSQNPENRIH